MEVLLSTTYFGPIQWYQKLYRAEHVVIEQWESFQKQTYRSLMKDIRISDHGNWRHLHWNALQSAYGESPFFEYYQDDILPFFTQRWDYLFDFNEAIRQKICELIDISPQVSLTKSFNAEADHDFREAINPKHPAPDADFESRPYYQVYQQKHGFLSNLSILDLLMNTGPESILYL